MSDLEPILQYNMNDMEAKAFKLCLLWHEILRKELPEYRKDRIKRGDPRKSLIFKYCYKLARETQGIIPDEDYKLYITAQIQVLKSIKSGDVHALVEPGCLVGERAWKRWKMWKYKYDFVYKKQTNEGTILNVHINHSRLHTELVQTRVWLQNQLGEHYTLKDLQRSKLDLVKWIAFSKVSPYYVVLSSFVKQHFGDPFEAFGIDPELYEKDITDNIRQAFKVVFPEEA